MLLTVSHAYSKMTTFPDRETTQKLHGSLPIPVMINSTPGEGEVFQTEKIGMGQGNIPTAQLMNILEDV